MRFNVMEVQYWHLKKKNIYISDHHLLGQHRGKDFQVLLDFSLVRTDDIRLQKLDNMPHYI